MTMPRREKIVLSTLASIGALLALLIAGPPEAGATPLSFIQSLNDKGFDVYDTKTALSWGYAICGTLDAGFDGAETLKAFYSITDGDVPDYDTAYLWVETSVEELCPQFDRRNDGMTYS